jgi:hypothetical protein
MMRLLDPTEILASSMPGDEGEPPEGQPPVPTPGTEEKPEEGDPS